MGVYEKKTAFQPKSYSSKGERGLKKALSLILSLALLLSLCGCSLKDAVFAEASEYIVTAMGFDEEEEDIKITMEALIINSEDAEAENKLVNLTGSAATIEKALQEIYIKTAQPLMLSHMGVIAIGESISQDRFNEICNYCYRTDEITVSVMMISVKDASALFSCLPISSITVGYDIMSMLKAQSNRTGMSFKNRFFEIEALRKLPSKITVVPFFEVLNDSFFYNGMAVFKNGEKTMQLTAEETAVYSIATDNQTSGKIFIKENLAVKSAYSKFTFKKGIENPILSIRLKPLKEADASAVKDGIEQLFLKSQKADTDIFCLENAYYNKQPDEYKAIGESFEDLYKKIRLSVEIK